MSTGKKYMINFNDECQMNSDLWPHHVMKTTQRFCGLLFITLHELL